MALLGVSSLAAATPALGATDQQNSAFARDRNVTVDERYHPEYAPLDIQYGSWVLQPEIDIGLTHSDDVFFTTSDRASDFDLQVAPSIHLHSNWDRNGVTGFLNTSYDKYFAYASEDAAQADLGATYRLDTYTNSYVDFTGEYANQVEPRSATNYNTSYTHPLRYNLLQVSVDSITELNRFKYDFAAGDRATYYYNPTLSGGGVQNYSFNNSNVLTAHGQVDYAMTPGMSVYYYLGLNDRLFQGKSSGVDRDSRGFDTAVGTSFDITRLARGDVRIGYLRQSYSASIKPVSGPSLQGSIDYFPTQLTTIVITGLRTISNTDVPSASSFVTLAGSATVEHELFRNVILMGVEKIEHDTYNGSCSTPGCVFGRNDNRWTTTLGATYLLNRRVGLKFNYSYEVLHSAGPTRAPSYTANVLQFTTILRY